MWLLYFYDGPYSRYEDLLRNDSALDGEFRRQLLAHRYIFQPMALKRLYLSASYDKAIIESALGVIEDILRRLAASQVRPVRERTKVNLPTD